MYEFILKMKTNIQTSSGLVSLFNQTGVRIYTFLVVCGYICTNLYQKLEKSSITDTVPFTRLNLVK